MSRLSNRSDTALLSTTVPPAVDVSQRPRTLLIGFIALHALFLLALLPSIIGGDALGDLELYREWAVGGINTGVWHGLELPWVYPIGALVPIVMAAGAGAAHYMAMWFLLTMALNALALIVLTDFGRDQSRFAAAWWMLLVTFLLSPVGLLRLEGIVAPLVVIALVWLSRRPFAAGVLLAIATWIKVWPVAVILAVLSAGRRRITVFLAGLLVTGGIVVVVGLLGGLRNILTFVTAQSDRSLQLEAPIATPWVWAAALGQPRSYIYQNVELATREVAGIGVPTAAAWMTPLMLIAVSTITVLLVIARRKLVIRAAGWSRAASEELMSLVLHGALALTLALIVFNKVGSPQYMLWITPIVVVGLAYDVQRWRVPSMMMLVISVLTTLIFPIFYMPLAAGNIGAVSLLTARNLLLVALLVWSLCKLVQFAWRPDAAPVEPLQRQLVSAASVRGRVNDSAPSSASGPSVSGGK